MDAGITASAFGQGAAERARTPRRLLTLGLALGVLADSALRAAPDGVGWTLWVLALALAAVNVARFDGLATTREQRAWLALAVACALAFSWRDAEALRVANVLGSLVALTMFAMSAAGRPAASILVARLRDIVAAGVYTIRDLAIGTPMLVAREADVLALPAARGGAAWAAIRAMLLTAPLVLVFTVLLSRADPVFAAVFRLPAIDAERIASHVLVTGAFAWWSAGWLRGALFGSALRQTLPQRLPVRLGLAEVTTSLGAVIALFAVFVALQLRWLFAGADVVVATTGLTVAEYARRGFFELVAVSALVLPLILGTRAAIEEARVLRRHRTLSTALLLLLAPIMASAALRLQLYVGYFGLTGDRLYAAALMAWLALVSGATAFTVLRGHARPFAAIVVVSGFATLGALNAVNPDLLVARTNLARSHHARGVDYPYLARLSGDAMPTVVRALQAATPSPEACEAATSLRARWLRQAEASWNLGARRGRAAATDALTARHVSRLCSVAARTRQPS